MNFFSTKKVQKISNITQSEALLNKFSVWRVLTRKLALCFRNRKGRLLLGYPLAFFLCQCNDNSKDLKKNFTGTFFKGIWQKSAWNKGFIVAFDHTDFGVGRPKRQRETIFACYYARGTKGAFCKSQGECFRLFRIFSPLNVKRIKTPGPFAEVYASLNLERASLALGVFYSCSISFFDQILFIPGMDSEVEAFMQNLNCKVVQLETPRSAAKILHAKIENSSERGALFAFFLQLEAITLRIGVSIWDTLKEKLVNLANGTSICF